MKRITIEGQIRTDFGKSATRRLRSEDHVPAVIYGGAKEINFSAPALAFRDIIYTADFMLAEISVDGTTYECVLKDMQFDKVTDKLLHVDFLELVGDIKVVVDIPLNFVGTPRGVRDGGRLITQLKKVKVKTYPQNLVENIEVDITKLRIGQNIRIKDISVTEMKF